MLNEGPQNEIIFNEKHKVECLKDLLRKQGYTENQIAEAANKGKNYHNGLLAKAIARMQHYNDDLYVKPKMFDRWRQYVHLRRLFRYWGNYVNKRSEFIKCDIAVAFDRWKNYEQASRRNLEQLPREELEHKVLNAQSKMEGLADKIADKENIVGGLSGQREALIENYMKGQRLGLALWRDRHHQ